MHNGAVTNQKNIQKYQHKKVIMLFLLFEGHRLTRVLHRPFGTGHWRTGRRPPELLQSLWSRGAGWWSTEHHPLLLLQSLWSRGAGW